MTINYSLEAIETVAKQIIQYSTSKVLLFNGDMGVGKTTLIKELVRLLGSEDAISSPTYSLVNEYKTPDDSIFHFDLYRIENEEELYNFGIEEYLSSNNWLLVEWPEILKDILQTNTSNIHIKQNENGTRTLTMSV
ncbi:tRNA (adenosine(37)-N6)-threonylcarbamoyltransferase complex ATPase subunit type 1 TsaE [Pontimicrobium sp. MEBiC06410]